MAWVYVAHLGNLDHLADSFLRIKAKYIWKFMIFTLHIITPSKYIFKVQLTSLFPFGIFCALHSILAAFEVPKF